MRETRLRRRLAATLLSIAASLGGSAVAQEGETVYKCTHSDGRIVYSDRPCADAMPDRMEIETIIAPPPGSGGEAARQGIKRLADEYDARQKAEKKAREEARRRELERRLSNPDVLVVTPWGDEHRHYSYTPGRDLSPYDRYRDPGHGGMRLDDDGFSFWYDSGRHPPHRPPRHDHPPHRSPEGDRPRRDPYSSDGRPIKEPGYSGRYPGGFPGYR